MSFLKLLDFPHSVCGANYHINPKREKSQTLLDNHSTKSVIFWLCSIYKADKCVNRHLLLTITLPLNFKWKRGRLVTPRFLYIYHLAELRYYLWSISLVKFSHLVVSNSLQPHGLQHTRLPCPSPTPRTCSNSCPSSQWCHETISSSVFPFSSCLQSFLASGSFPMN